MASTYTTNIGAQKPATGDKSGTWGTMTNTNFDIIDQSLGYGTKTIASASTDTITIPSDGTTSDNRALFLKCSGGDQNCTVTLAPNDSKKLYIIENATSFILTFSQGGSGANVAIKAGQVKVLATDGGGGTNGIVYDVFQDLSIPDLFVDDDLSLISDSAALKFGADSEITITHSADEGLKFKNTNTGDDKPMSIYLQTGETDIAVNDYLGRIFFQAPDESTGTDAVTIAAEVSAISEGDFSSSNNATSLSFGTGSSGASVQKMKLSSTGVLTLNGSSGSIIIPDAGNIGSASDTDAIAISSAGLVTCSGALTVNGHVILGSDASDNITFNGDVVGHVTPNADSTYTLGTDALRWLDVYADDVFVGSDTNAGGQLFIGTTSALGGTSKCYFKFYGAGTRYGMSMGPAVAGHTYYLYFVNASNTFVGGISMDSDNAGVTFAESSDYRLKENITDLTGAIDRVKALKPKRFSFKIDENKTIKDGFLAHEAAEVVPEAVTGEKDAMKDGEIAPQSIDRSRMIPVLTGALQEAIAKIEVLESKVAALEAS